MSKKLFVIEAPGKISSFRSILTKIGIECDVVATKGHLYSFPEKLDNLGIDKNFFDIERKCINPTGVKFMREAARNCDEVIIATDADAEGDVIAWDVHELLKDIHTEIFRLKLKGMDADSVKDSLEHITPVKKEDAIPGRTRAMVDRMIGHTFSQNGIGVGRVLTALLGIIVNDKPSPIRVKLSAPSKDNGRPWVSFFDLTAPIDESIASRLIELNLPALSMKSSSVSNGQPLHMGDIMIKAGDELGMTPTESAKALQNNYESGFMSYPRSGSRGMSKGAQRRLKRMIQKSGFKGNNESIKEKDESEVHDAPYPIGDVDISKDPRKLGDDQGIRTLVARNIIKASQEHKKETADSRLLFEFIKSSGFSAEVSQFVANLEWTREIGPNFPGQKSWEQSSIEIRMPETVLLERAVELGLGKPSTWAKHIDGFMDRGLVDENLILTSKGEQWVQGSPKELLDARLSAAIEKACDKIIPSILEKSDKEAWSHMAEKIVKALPSQISGKIVERLPEHNPSLIVTYENDVAAIDPQASTIEQRNDVSHGYLPQDMD